MDIRTNVENTPNRLLTFMSAGDRQLLAPNLKHVELALRQTLEKANHIRSKRGMITILDRPTLMKLTNGSYGAAAANVSGFPLSLDGERLRGRVRSARFIERLRSKRAETVPVLLKLLTVQE